VPLNLPSTRAGRASPLPPDERRTAILRAVQEVVLERGAAVTTHDLAAAAGVAEGTLFRVFEDKATLLREVVLAAVDPSQVLPQLAQVDLAAPLAERVATIVRIGQARVERTVAWMSLLHQLGRAERGGHLGGPPPGWADRRATVGVAIRAQIVRGQQPDDLGADRFRYGLDTTADLLEIILVGAAVRAAEAARTETGRTAPDADTVVAMFLSGVLEPGTPSDPELEGSSTC